MAYQWRLNNVDLPGATNARLELPSLSLDAAGLYSVVASNPFGVITNLAAEVVCWNLRLTNGCPTFVLAGPPEGTYVLDYSDRLGGNWQSFKQITLTEGMAVMPAEQSPASRRFYRLRRRVP